VTDNKQALKEMFLYPWSPSMSSSPPAFLSQLNQFTPPVNDNIHLIAVMIVAKGKKKC